ncbi:hypothetical protein ZWY2020_003023 [Hordeum vulgare]|nr:hypothetical protein ZWY2020_003023 [Hordeum vulgare]
MPDSADPVPSPPPEASSAAATKPVSVDPDPPQAPEAASPAAKPVSTDPAPLQAPEAASPAAAAAAAKPVSTDPLPPQAPEAATPAAAARPDLDGLPSRSTPARKLRKPLTDKLRAVAEERLARLPVDLRLCPVDPPPIFGNEVALSYLGVLDFARFGLGSEPPRPDLVAQFIAYYDPTNHRSFIWDTRVSFNRTDLATVFNLPRKSAPPPARPRGLKTNTLVSAALDFMRVCIHPLFADCKLPQEVAAAEQAVKAGSPHKVNWAGLIWGLIEKEINDLPKKDHGVCKCGAYLQRLISHQKPHLFGLPQKEEAEKLVRKASFDLVKDERDGDTDARNKALQELEPRDADADASSKSLKESELEGTSLTSKSLGESGPADADASGNDLKELESGDARSNILEEPDTEEFAWERDGDTFVGAAEKDACLSPGLELLTQERVLTVPEEDEEAEEEEEKDEEAEEEEEKDEEAEEEEEKDEAGWSSANDGDDSMDVEDNVSVQNLDSDNEEGCSGGVEMNWDVGDDKGGEGTAPCLQQCDFPGVEFENLNKGNVGMRDGVSFDDGFKMGSLHGMESNLLQAMNSDTVTYNGTENAHHLSSGNFLAIGADVHKNGVDLGAGDSFFFGNNGKRHVEDIDDGYDDQMQTQQQFLQGNQHKRMRNSNSSVPPGSAFFNANYSDPIQNLLVNASMLYEQKEREIQEGLSQKQFMANLLQEKDAIIDSLNSARFEQENKWQAKLRSFEHDLNVMGQMDVPNGGGLVLSVNELERKRWEEEQQKRAAAAEMIENFKLEWLSKPDDWEKRICHLISSLIVRGSDVKMESSLGYVHWLFDVQQRQRIGNCCYFVVHRRL